MYTLPKDLYDDLIFAAENAQYPGMCTYDIGIAKEKEALKAMNPWIMTSRIPVTFKTHEPCCVIAQLYAKRGGNVADLNEGCGITVGLDRNFSQSVGADFNIFKGYSSELLGIIQAVWDESEIALIPPCTNEKLVAYVKSVVEVEE